ncbi:MAG: hypothetical protein U0164_19120 [Gemmatimonadaceae bacterium]
MPSRRPPRRSSRRSAARPAGAPATRAATDTNARPEPLPPQRYMTVIAQDPAVRHKGKIVTARIAVPAEALRPGPMGYRLQLVDYDATARRFNGEHELPARYEDEPRAWQDGDPSIVDDYRFHAQNSYALVMRTLARFEFALGRRIGWSFRTHQLKVAPHGMYDANAFYTPEQEGLVLGYFAGVSGAPVFTCLSHDIVVHETTHALIDALRPRFMDPSTPDQAAFHEGLADVVALLSVFSQPEVVTHLLRGHDAADGMLIARKDVLPEALRESALFGLADQMGSELASLRGSALRRSASIDPDPSLKDSYEFLESHRRGELFVAAVIRGFVDAWSARILSSGTPTTKRFPLERVAEEGASIADALVTMWIRALDYMPPVHLEFGDALSAALTADLEVRPDDSRYQLREHMRRNFAAFGFAPASRRKDLPGIWNPPPSGLRYDRVRFESMKSDADEVFRFIWDNRERLELRDGAYTQVLSVNPSVRIGFDGFVVRETVVTYYQVARLTPDELAAVGVKAPADYLRRLAELDAERRQKREADAARRTARSAVAPPDESPDEGADASDDDQGILTPLYGGGVLIFDEYGHVKYWVHNDVFGSSQQARLKYLWEEGLLLAKQDGARLRAERLSSLHRARALGVRRAFREGW